MNIDFQISRKTKIIISIVVVATAFASGRYSVQSPKVKTEIQVSQQTQENDVKNTHTKTTITETKKPDGTDTKTTVIDQVANENDTEHQQTNEQLKQTVTPPKLNTLNISVLGANDFRRGIAPTYGLSVSKQFIGPIRVGAFGLMNGIIGVSIGLDF